jgi:hypothetical protein
MAMLYFTYSSPLCEQWGGFLSFVVVNTALSHRGQYV